MSEKKSGNVTSSELVLVVMIIILLALAIRPEIVQLLGRIDETLTMIKIQIGESLTRITMWR